MTQKQPPRHPPTPNPEQASGSSPPGDELEPAIPEDAETAPDPYDDLWDPDMDTRPERIKRTKARRKPDARLRGRSMPGSKRRDEA